MPRPKWRCVSCVVGALYFLLPPYDFVNQLDFFAGAAFFAITDSSIETSGARNPDAANAYPHA